MGIHACMHTMEDTPGWIHGYIPYMWICSSNSCDIILQEVVKTTQNYTYMTNSCSDCSGQLRTHARAHLPLIYIAKEGEVESLIGAHSQGWMVKGSGMSCRSGLEMFLRYQVCLFVGDAQQMPAKNIRDSPAQGKPLTKSQKKSYEECLQSRCEPRLGLQCSKAQKPP